MCRVVHYVPSDNWTGLRHLARFPLAARRGFRGGRPLGTKFFRTADDAFDEITGRLFLRGSIGSGAVGRNFKQLEFFEYGFHGAVGIPEKFRAADAREDPAHALEDGLAIHVLRKFFEGMIAVAIALDGKAAAVAFDDQVDSKRTHSPLWRNAITGGNEALHDFALEGGLGALLLFFEHAHEAAGILGVLDQLATKVVGLEVVVGTEGVDNPHLVAGAAGGDVEALLEQFLVAEGERAALRSVNQRDEDDVAFVALELSGVTAQKAMEFVAVGRKMGAEKIVNLDGLFVADQRDHAEAGGLAGIVFLVFRLLDRRGEEGGGGQGLLTIDLAVATGAGNAIGDGVRLETDAAGVAQGLNAVIVGDQVAELDDFLHATEMCDETSGAAEGLAREVIDGNLTIVEIGIGDSREVLEDQVLDDAEILADGGRADLLVVSHDEDGFSEIESDEGHDVALAGFVDDDHVETSGARVEIFDHAGKRHHPDRNGAAAFGHFPGGFSTQERNANAVAFADAANGVQPSDERLALAGGSAAGLSGPSALVNEADGDAAKLFAKFFALGLERFEGNAGAAVEFIVELSPSPGRGGIAGRLTAAVNSSAVADSSGPRRSSALKLREQGAAQIEVGLAALEFEEALVGVAIAAGILVIHGGKEFGSGLRRFGEARGELETALEFAKFLLELEQFQLLEARVQNGKEGVRDGFVNAHQCTIGTDDRRLFGKKFFPAQAEIFELLLKGEPGLRMPVQATPDGIAKLHQRFFNFFAHFTRRGRPERRHLTVPAPGEFLAQVFEARKLAQGLKMPGEARMRVVHFCGFDEMVPGFMREERERTEFAAIFKMAENFARDALLI